MSTKSALNTSRIMYTKAEISDIAHTAQLTQAKLDNTLSLIANLAFNSNTIQASHKAIELDLVANDYLHGIHDC